jgi:hypothetical protein
MPNKIVIESYGTPGTTKLFFDDVEVKDIRNMRFSVDVDDLVTYINIGYATGVAAKDVNVDELDAIALNAVRVSKEITNE